MIPAIERRTGARFVYVPVLLGGVFKATGNVSPAVSLHGIKNKGEYMARETQRSSRRHGITRFVAESVFPVDTLQIMRGAVAAQRLGCFARYVDEVYRARVGGSEGDGRTRWCCAALLESRLPADELLARAADSDVEQELLATEASSRTACSARPASSSATSCSSARPPAEVEEEIEAQRAG